MSDTLKKPTEIKLDWIFYDGDFYSIEKCIKIKICFKLKTDNYVLEDLWKYKL